MRKMKNVQESRRNMRVDMRPKVVAKTMTKELLLALTALTCGVGTSQALPSSNAGLLPEAQGLPRRDGQRAPAQAFGRSAPRRPREAEGCYSQ